jgi:hypothetical protein
MLSMGNGRVFFECPICKAAITRPLLPLGPDQQLCLENGKAAVPEGFFGVKTREQWSAKGSTLVNLSDLVGTHHHPDVHRLAGCCGLDGMDGPNLLCANGHEIGTEKSDCWMPHAAVLLGCVVRVYE